MDDTVMVCVSKRMFVSVPNKGSSFGISPRVLQKVISASDAASLVQNGDTLCVSGFVCQGSQRLSLRHLAIVTRAKDLSIAPHCSLLAVLVIGIVEA